MQPKKYLLEMQFGRRSEPKGRKQLKPVSLTAMIKKVAKIKRFEASLTPNTSSH